MDKIESNIANITKTNKLQKRITAQEQDKVFLHHDLSEYLGHDLGEKGRPFSEELRPIN